MNKYLEEGSFKSKYIFYKSIINRLSVDFTKPMVDYKILAYKDVSFVTNGHKSSVFHFAKYDSVIWYKSIF